MIALNRPLAIAAGRNLVGAVEIIFPVESVAAAYANLTARDCVFKAAPHEVTAALWAATFSDPDGHWLTILGPK